MITWKTLIITPHPIKEFNRPQWSHIGFVTGTDKDQALENARGEFSSVSARMIFPSGKYVMDVVPSGMQINEIGNYVIGHYVGYKW